MAVHLGRVLVANRGEIARRIFASCRRMEMETVAVYSEADADLPFVAEADMAVAIGPSPARASYLDAARVLDAARRSGATAVHPGYGFLAESADFAEAVEAAGLLWVGPRPETIQAMGDKAEARRIAEAAGVPVAPGSTRFGDDALEGIEAAARDVGFPLLIKAAAGGGGIGMSRVEAAGDVRKAAEATRSMARKAFGDGTIFLERFIPRARHVEVQVFGDGAGGGIHLFERDCSLQRRYQKVIEEAPAPGLTSATRARMAQAALALVRETGYAGAGTVEFILDAETEAFFFLEMNTRIQVEHPVTEMITGTDIVAMQFALAFGEELALDQDDFAVDGASVECRLYAENPAKRFFPSPGLLTRLRLPAGSTDLRIEAAYAEGNRVTPNYDPLIAKIVAHGKTRDAAIDRAVAALRATEVEGLKTNRDFLVACLEDEGFRAGKVYTGFIDDHASFLLPTPAT